MVLPQPSKLKRRVRFPSGAVPERLCENRVSLRLRGQLCFRKNREILCCREEAKETVMDSEEKHSYQELMRRETGRLIESGLTDEEAQVIARRRLRSYNRSKSELPLLVILALAAAVSVRLLFLFNLTQSDAFLIRFIVPSAFLPATLFLCYELKVSWKETLFLAAMYIVLPLAVSAYPSTDPGHTAMLASLHLPVIYLFILMWMSGRYLEPEKKREVQHAAAIQLTGETALFTVLSMLGWLVVTGILITITDLLGFQVDDQMEFWIPSGFAALVSVSVSVSLKALHQERKLAQMLSAVYVPVVDLLLLVLIAAFLFRNESTSDNRDLLLIVDGLLTLVLCMILFSPVQEKRTLRYFLDTLLIALAVVLDVIALVMMSFRLASSGITVNKTAAFVLNILFLTHLILIGASYIRDKTNTQRAKTGFLPVYAIWSGFVVYVFPFLFAFR